MISAHPFAMSAAASAVGVGGLAGLTEREVVLPGGRRSNRPPVLRGGCVHMKSLAGHHSPDRSAPGGVSTSDACGASPRYQAQSRSVRGQRVVARRGTPHRSLALRVVGAVRVPEADFVCRGSGRHAYRSGGRGDRRDGLRVAHAPMPVAGSIRLGGSGRLVATGEAGVVGLAAVERLGHRSPEIVQLRLLAFPSVRCRGR